MSAEIKEVQSDPKLIAEGWTRRFLAAPDRAEEALAIYRDMDCEVRAEKLTPDAFAEECSQCSAQACHEYVLIYTRKRDG